jgi:hypothetical protein
MCSSANINVFTCNLTISLFRQPAHVYSCLIDGAKEVHLTKDMFTRPILPIGLLFSDGFILSNTVYLYHSLAYIQKLKVDTLFLPPRLSIS